VRSSNCLHLLRDRLDVCGRHEGVAGDRDEEVAAIDPRVSVAEVLRVVPGDLCDITVEVVVARLRVGPRSASIVTSAAGRSTIV
jgi:hypothetical protein